MILAGRLTFACGVGVLASAALGLATGCSVLESYDGYVGDGGTNPGSGPDARAAAATDSGAIGTGDAAGDGCQPKSCKSYGYSCGSASDGCGHTLDCGTCTTPATCGGSGVPGQCGCQGTTCTASCTKKTSCPTGLDCGMQTDGCSGMISCGTCSGLGQTCGGGGTPNVCGCMPATQCTKGQNCGTQADGCGGNLACGTCTAPDACDGGGPNVCGPQCGPLVQYQWSDVIISTAPVTAATTPQDCQVFCNATAGTACCAWWEGFTYNGNQNPCFAYPQSDAVMACQTDWVQDPVGGDAGADRWGVICL
jgi:hypothetical protein